jgi:hypothetical protein
MNTNQKGKVRYMVFKEKAIWYAVALEFNLVVTGDDDTVALINLFDAMKGYVEAVNKIKGVRVSPLNQEADEEYEKMWQTLNSPKTKGIKSPFISGLKQYS